MSGVENLLCVPGKEFLVRWLIKNVSMFGIRKNQSSTTETFIVPFLGNTEWFLQLLFKQQEENNIRCFLRRNNHGPEYVKVYYSISMGSSYVADLQTFSQDSFSLKAGLFNRGKFIEDVLQIECRLWLDPSSDVPAPISPYPVGIEMVLIVPQETLSLYYKIPNFSNFKEGQAIEFSVNSGRNYSGSPKFTCKLWLGQQILRVLVRESNNEPTCFRLKSNVHLLDAFRDRHFLYRGSTVINYGYPEEPSCETMQFSLSMSKKQLMEKKDLYLPCDELLLHWEFAISFNEGNENFFERTLYDEPSGLQVKPKLKWGIYLEHKYNEHRFFFRLLTFLVVVLSVLPHLSFINTP